MRQVAQECCVVVEVDDDAEVGVALGKSEVGSKRHVSDFSDFVCVREQVGGQRVDRRQSVPSFQVSTLRGAGWMIRVSSWVSLLAAEKAARVDVA